MKAIASKVFIVDDDDAVRDALKILLESYGIAVEDFASATEFVRHYRPGARQCLILDQDLPQTTGLDFLESRQAAALHLPVILLTGRGNRAIRDRALGLGVDAYLEKPVHDHVLLATISRVVDAGS
ncbi:MAG TPA: response regulator [Stellaceae bacterium]|nr:response regulator [Stellaceae bacterium]